MAISLSLPLFSILRPAFFGKGPKVAKLTEQDRDRLERQYRFFVHPILESLKRVKKVVAHIHKIEISTTLLADDIKLSTGQVLTTHPINNVDNDSYYTRKRNFNYFGLKGFIRSYPYYKELENGDYSDKQNFIRASIITITPDGYIEPAEHKKLLLRLQNDLRSGDVIVRYVEISLDFFPEKRNLVPSLFESLAKIIYIPYISKKNDIIFDGGQLYREKKRKIGSQKKPNDVVERLNRVIKFKDQYKLYERSDDDKHVKTTFEKNGLERSVKAYRKKDLNRVRFEQNLLREQLRKKNIKTLKDFVDYSNSDGANILHHLFDIPKFKIIDTGPRKFDYVCLMSTINGMKHKQGYHQPLRRLYVNLLRNKIKRAIIDHSEKWFSDSTKNTSDLEGQKVKKIRPRK